MKNRQAGVLLHPTSLPNAKGGLGVLDVSAWKFVDWLASAGLSLWQMLPLTEPHADLSPYQSVSAFAMNPGLLKPNWQDELDENEFNEFMHTPPFWLSDYSLFMAIKEVENGLCWVDWPQALKFRHYDALQAFALEHKDKIELLNKQQFVLSKTWQQLKTYANQNGVELFGDMPIFVAYDSVDVWANPDKFLLDENLQPTVVTGVPPDYFSETGQRWGNPHYDWQAMQASGFSWWQQRLESAFAQFDLVRIDHFRGFEAVWEIDAKEETAINGKWVKTAGEALLDKLQTEFEHLPLVAEDLGIITPEVVALKQKYDLPGMSVLQFGFNGLPDNPHSLYEQVENSITYTGTHDNDTSMGWFNSLDDGTKSWVMEQLNNQLNELISSLEMSAEIPPALLEEIKQMPWPFIAAACKSVASSVIIPMQDFLALDSKHRMNIPGVAEGNWTWQFEWQQISEDLAPKIALLLKASAR